MSDAKPTPGKKNSSKVHKKEGFYTSIVVQGDVRALYFANVLTHEQIAKQCGISVDTVARIINDPETQEIAEKLISQKQRSLATSLLISKATAAVARVVEKEMEKGTDNRAREILIRFGLLPGIVKAPEGVQPAINLNLSQTHTMVAGMNEGQKQLLARVVEHVGEMEKSFPASLPAKVAV